MILYIVRHGETDWNKGKRVQGHRDIPLNDYGRHLAEETWEGMKDIRIDLVYTSPLSRAKETAVILAGNRQIPIYEDARIMEIGFGCYEGVCLSGDGSDEKAEKFGLFFSDTGHYTAPEDGETVGRLYERTGDFLEEICSREDLAEKRILISTHGAAMTAILNRIRGNLSIPDFWRYEVPPNCAVTTVKVKDGRAEIVDEGRIYYTEKVRKWAAV